MADWQPQRTALRAIEVTVRTQGGKTFRASWDWVDNADPHNPGDVVEWAAVNEKDAPDCWSDGICWASNAECLPSDPVVEWRP